MVRRLPVRSERAVDFGWSGPFELWHGVAMVAAMLVIVWGVQGARVRVAGTWERVDEGLSAGKQETISLIQFGPFVRGRTPMPGGFQELTGFVRGRTVYLSRRDHGEAFIVSQGFPKEVARSIDGTVTARLRLTLSADGRAVFGSFVPQKIEFTRRPPAITRRLFLEPSFRRYRLTSRRLRSG